MTNVSGLKKIMYVDDDADLRKIAKLSLAVKGGFDVHVCESGEKALTDVTEFQPDLIILDVIMPDMDGPETLTALRNLPEISQVPIFFMTARLQPDELNRYKRLGAAGVIRKPFHPMTLADKINELWNMLEER
ncbi:MAG: response regulator [bacterium]|nr:response regulator [bacterium]